MQPHTEPHVLRVFQSASIEKDVSAFVIHRIKRTVYVEALSFAAIYDVLKSSPYNRQIRVAQVPKTEVHSVIRYLERPTYFSTVRWVRVKYSKDYRGDLALLSTDNTLLLMPRHRKPRVLKGRRKTNRRKDILSTTPVEGYTRVDVGGNFGWFIGLQHGLLCLELTTPIHSLDPCYGSVDKSFIEAVRQFLDTGHTDARHAWTTLWKTTWAIGSTVDTIDGTRGRIVSLDHNSQTVQLDTFSHGSILLSNVHRVFVAGERVVVALGSHAGKTGTVVHQPEISTILLLPDFDNRTEKDDDMREIMIASIYVLDFATHGSMFDTVGSLRVERPPKEKITMPEDEDITPTDVMIVGGSFKSYRGVVVDDRNDTYTVEIPGLVGNKRHIIPTELAEPLYVINFILLSASIQLV